MKNVFNGLLILLAVNSNITFAGDDMVEVSQQPKPVTVTLEDGRTAVRYLMKESATGATTADTMQELIVLDVIVHFFKDKARLELQGGTGGAFEVSWDNSGIGTPTTMSKDFNLRRVALTINAARNIDLTVGSMAPEYGAGTENSTFDNDAYIMGYRAKAKIEKGTLVVTGGFVGDYKNPNVFNRFGRMDEFNFVQAMYTRAIADAIQGSIEYDRLDKVDFARGAVKFDLKKWTSILDAVVFEDMKSLDNETAQNTFATKITKRFKSLFLGQDVQFDAYYVYKSDRFDIITADKTFKGRQLRFTMTLPDLLKTKKTKLVLFADYVQSIDDLDMKRAEAGLTYKF